MPLSNYPFLLSLLSPVLKLDVLIFIKKIDCFNFEALSDTTLLIRKAYHKIFKKNRRLCNLQFSNLPVLAVNHKRETTILDIGSNNKRWDLTITR